MKCAKCGFEAPDGAKFCRRCGSLLQTPAPPAPSPGGEEAVAAAAESIRCPACGAALATGEKFCGDCGAKIEPFDVPSPHPRSVSPGSIFARSLGAGQPRRRWAWYVLGAAVLVVAGVTVALLLRTGKHKRKPLITKESAASLKPKVLARVRGNAYQIESTADGHTASVLAIGVDRGVILFDTETGAEVAKCPSNFGSYAISGDARVVAQNVGNRIVLCDPLSRSPLGSLQPGPAGFTSVALSPNGQLVATGRADGVVQLWDVATRRLLWTSERHASTGVKKVAVTDDKQVVALYFGPNTVWYWEEGRGHSQFDLRPAGNTASNIRMLSFVAPEKVLVSLGGATWQLDVSAKVGRIRSFPFGANALAPDGRTVVSVGKYLGLGQQGYTPLTIWDLDKGDQVATLDTPRGMLAVSATFTRNGTALLATTNGGEILEWPLHPQPVQSLSGGPTTPAAGPMVLKVPPNSVIMDEFNDSSAGETYGIKYVSTPTGQGALFSREADSRIEYRNRIPSQGTLEWWIKVSSGYHRQNFQLYANQNEAMIFSTDASGGDVTWPGTTKLSVSSEGGVSLFMATNKYNKPPAPPLLAMVTPFRFNQWHSIGISYGSEGEYIMVDGHLVASAPTRTQTLGVAGTHQQPLDVPTIGDTVSHFWRPHQYDGGFEGIVDRFRASANQRDWALAAVKLGKSPNQAAAGSHTDVKGSHASAGGAEFGILGTLREPPTLQVRYLLCERLRNGPQRLKDAISAVPWSATCANVRTGGAGEFGR